MRSGEGPLMGRMCLARCSLEAVLLTAWGGPRQIRDGAAARRAGREQEAQVEAEFFRQIERNKSAPAPLLPPQPPHAHARIGPPALACGRMSTCGCTAAGARTAAADLLRQGGAAAAGGGGRRGPLLPGPPRPLRPTLAG